MEIDVFKQDLSNQWLYESEKIFDGFKSLMVQLNYYTYSTFQLNVGLTPENVRLFIPETILYMEGLYFYVDSAKAEDSNNDEMVVTGRSLLGKSRDRIVYRKYSRSARPEQIVWDHLSNELVSPSDSKRKIHYLSLVQVPDFGRKSIQYQNSYGNVAEEIETLCTSYDFGIRETAVSLGEPNNKIEFYQGRDLTQIVEFSEDFENLKKSGYQNNNFDESTTAIVFGEGDGGERKSVVINPEVEGLKRKELYVDARDLQQESDEKVLTDAEYEEALTDRGVTKLSERQRILTLTGEVQVGSKLFKLGTDYWLGDKVTIKSKRYNLKKEVVITTINKTYDKDGLFIEPIFGKETPTIYDVLGRE